MLPTFRQRTRKCVVCPRSPYVYAYAYTYFLPRASNSNCARCARARRKLRIDMARETSAHAYVQQTRNANLTQCLLRACARVRCVRCAAAFLDSALVAECFRGVATPQTPPPGSAPAPLACTATEHNCFFNPY